MCRNRRDRRKSRGQVMFITARVRKGLPFVARCSIEKIITGILARAQGLYPVKICAFVFMGNHYHLIITGQSCHLSPFMNYIQGCIAKSMQRLIPNFYDGWFWEGRYKEQVLCTVEDVVDKMAYIYLNPVRARLVDKVIQYPGLNSYKYLSRNKYSTLAKWIPIRKLKELPVQHRRKEDLDITRDLLKSADKFEELTIEPFAWFSGFREKLSAEAVMKRLLDYVDQEEQKPASKALGAAKLIEQPTRKAFTPKANSPTPYIICCDKELRISEILSYKNFCRLCKEAWQLVKKGLHCVWPKGAYLPSMQWGWSFVT